MAALPEISEQEMLFVQEYVKDKNRTRAALSAGLSTSYHGATQAACKLLKKGDIRRWVKHLLVRQAKALKFKPSKVLRNWMLATSADLTYFETDEKGRLTTAPGVPREYLRAVRKMKQTRTVRTVKNGQELEEEIRTEIELRDPFGPECKLMEHFGELAGEKSNAPSVDALGLVAALLNGRLTAGAGGGGPAGGDPGGAAVDAEPRPAE